MHHLSLDYEYSQCRHGPEKSPFQTRIQRELTHVPWAAELTDSIHLIADNCLQLKTFTLHILSDSVVYSPLIRPFNRDYNLLDAALNGTTVFKANLWAVRHGGTPHQRHEGRQSLLHETRGQEALASHHDSYLGRALCKIRARDLITFVAFSGFMGGPVDSWAELRSALLGAFWQRKEFTLWPQLSLCKQQRQALDRLAILPHPSQEVPFVNVWHYRPDGSRLEKAPEWKSAVDGEVERDLEKVMWRDGQYCSKEESVD